METRPVPIYIMEEHHQAFYLWHYAVNRGIIPESGNILVHVDAHADLDPPIVRMPFKDIASKPKKIREYTFSELGIANFIIPAVYEGIFNSYAWIYPDFVGSGTCSSAVQGTPGTAQSQSAAPCHSEKHVRTYQNRGQVYVISDCPAASEPEISIQKPGIAFDCFQGAWIPLSAMENRS